jgi:hypothetical protein
VEPGTVEWSHALLYGAVSGLPTSLTEGRTVEALAAWVDTENGVCIVYQYPWFYGVLGCRVSADGVDGRYASDLAKFAGDIADFRIGEPLGNAPGRYLRADAHGVAWKGALGEELPQLPDSPRLREIIAQAIEAQAGRRLREDEECAASPPRLPDDVSHLELVSHQEYERRFGRPPHPAG